MATLVKASSSALSAVEGTVPTESKSSVKSSSHARSAVPPKSAGKESNHYNDYKFLRNLSLSFSPNGTKNGDTDSSINTVMEMRSPADSADEVNAVAQRQGPGTSTEEKNRNVPRYTQYSQTLFQEICTTGERPFHFVAIRSTCNEASNQDVIIPVTIDKSGPLGLIIKDNADGVACVVTVSPSAMETCKVLLPGDILAYPENIEKEIIPEAEVENMLSTSTEEKSRNVPRYTPYAPAQFEATCATGERPFHFVAIRSNEASNQDVIIPVTIEKSGPLGLIIKDNADGVACVVTVSSSAMEACKVLLPGDILAYKPIQEVVKENMLRFIDEGRKLKSFLRNPDEVFHVVSSSAMEAYNNFHPEDILAYLIKKEIISEAEVENVRRFIDEDVRRFIDENKRLKYFLREADDVYNAGVVSNLLLMIDEGSQCGSAYSARTGCTDYTEGTSLTGIPYVEPINKSASATLCVVDERHGRIYPIDEESHFSMEGQDLLDDDKSFLTELTYGTVAKPSDDPAESLDGIPYIEPIIPDMLLESTAGLTKEECPTTSAAPVAKKNKTLIKVKCKIASVLRKSTKSSSQNEAKPDAEKAEIAAVEQPSKTVDAEAETAAEEKKVEDCFNTAADISTQATISPDKSQEERPDEMQEETTDDQSLAVWSLL